ncbi:MAG: BspA family leucine-rich repeat surface protein [Erysipelotrichaceae bacterium]|nr:BspA family leucine-rich repeat surface protein [Erysipelotrichaceae bacterium]
MKNFLTKTLILSLLFISWYPCSINASTYDESYIIEIPEKVEIDDSKTFTIKIIENNLTDNQTLSINIDKNFTLKDKLEKQSVTGSIINNNIELTNKDTNDIVINYDLPPLSAGNWSGLVDINLKLETNAVSHMLIPGEQLSAILRKLQTEYGSNVFKKITFSKEKYTENYSDIDGEPYIDVSVGQDKSALLYRSALTTFTITSNGGEKLYANYDASYMFDNVSFITTISDLNNLDTSYSTTMANMFDYCVKLTSLDISNFDTSNVTDMSHMFEGNAKLKTITGLDKINTANVNNMAYMFADCYVLATGLENVTNFDTANVVDMTSMFEEVNSGNKTYAVIDLDLSKWNMGKVTSVASMFSGTYEFKSITFPSKNKTSCLTTMSNMFYNNNYLDTINMNVFDTSNVTDMSNMFYMCKILKHTGNINNWDVSNVTDMSQMFYGTWNIIIDETGDLNSWNVAKLQNKEDMFSNSSSYINHEPSWY